MLVTLDELGANEVNIEHLIGKPFGPVEFYDQTYRAMELTMATPTASSRQAAAGRGICSNALAMGGRTAGWEV